MPRMQVIVNPASNRGDTRAMLSDLQEQIYQMAATSTASTYQLDWAVTEQPGHATTLALQAAQQGVDSVVAIGGDGTINEIVNGLLQVEADQRPRLGIVPAGTGNDFAANLGLPTDAMAAIKHLFAGSYRTVDAVTISDENGKQTFWNNTMGIGFSGAMTETALQKEKLRGFLLYLVAIIETIMFKPHQGNHLTIAIDRGETIEQQISMLAINNGPCEGGGFPTVPQAIVDDGQLSYVLMRKVNRLQMLLFLPIVMMARHLQFTKTFSPGEATHLRIESQEPLVIHTDGELFCVGVDGIHQVELEILPGALHVLQ